MGLEADAQGFSEIAFADQAGGELAPGDEKLLVKFYTRPRHDEEASKKEGRPIFVETEYVSVMVPGQKDNMIDDIATDIYRQRFAPHYRAFKQRKAGEDVAEMEGMPLAEWPGITRSQVEELAFYNVRTVEQLAGISDANTQGKMGLSMLKERAKAFLDATKDSAATEKLAHKLREKDEEIAGLKTTIAEMGDAIGELKAMMKAQGVSVSQPDSQSGSSGGGPNSG